MNTESKKLACPHCQDVSVVAGDIPVSDGDRCVVAVCPKCTGVSEMTAAGLIKVSDETLKKLPGSTITAVAIQKMMLLAAAMGLAVPPMPSITVDEGVDRPEAATVH